MTIITTSKVTLISDAQALIRFILYKDFQRREKTTASRQN